MRRSVSHVAPHTLIWACLVGATQESGPRPPAEGQTFGICPWPVLFDGPSMERPEIIGSSCGPPPVGGPCDSGQTCPMGRSLQLRVGGLREMPRARSRGWLLSALPLVGEALFLRPCLRAGLAWPHLSRSGSFCFALGLPGASGAYAGGAILEMIFSHLPGLSFCCCRCARVPLAIWGLAGKSSATILAGSWPGARQGRRCLRSGPPGARSSGEA
jgi:hypothetical protein